MNARQLRLATAAMILGACIAHFVTASAQKAEAEPKSRVWMSSAIEYKGGGTFMEVRVFDYPGVCLYVATTDLNGYTHGPIPAMAAISKTQLEKGVGCQ